MKFSRFKTSAKAEVQGVWVNAGEGLKLKVARTGNDEYRAFVRKAGKSLQVQARAGVSDEKAVDALTREAVSRHVLLGWENLEDDDGQTIPYSVEKAKELLDTKDFYELVLGFANDLNNFREEAVEEAKGN